MSILNVKLNFSNLCCHCKVDTVRVHVCVLHHVYVHIYVYIIIIIDSDRITSHAFLKLA